MKKICLFLAVMSIGLASQAQNFVFSTEKHISKDIKESFESLYIKFKTPSPESIVCKWKLLENSLASGWDYSLCDYGNCYIAIPFEGTMLEMKKEDAEAGTEIFFSLSLSTMKIDGEGTMKLYVYDSKDESRGDTVSFHVSYKQASSVPGISFSNAVNMYPNPTNKAVTFDAMNNNQIANIQFTNMNCSEVLRLDTAPTASVDVSTLTPGIYVVRIETMDGTQLTERLIIQ